MRRRETAESSVSWKELSARARVILVEILMPDTIWAEDMNHGNWIGNRLSSKIINNKLPLGLWRPKANIINIVKIPTFGQPGFEFMYRSSTGPNNKLSARALHICLVGMEIDQRPYRTYDPVAKKVCVVRQTDFQPWRLDQISSASILLDGLPRQSEKEEIINVYESADEGLHQDFAVNMSTFGDSSNLKD